jgi:hypothetical protein
MTGIDVSHAPSLHLLPFGTSVIYKCLAPCNECTRNYISQMLQKRFICNCICHSTKVNNSGSNMPHRREEGI